MTVEKNREIAAADLLDLWTGWAKDEGIDDSNEIRGELNRWLEDHGGEQVRRRETLPDGRKIRPRCWVGVGVADAPEPAQTDSGL